MLGICFALSTANAAEPLTRDPYRGLLVLDADTGRVLFEDGADLPCYPASVIKLLHLLVCLDAVDQGRVSLTDPVIVRAEAARMGGSQVYLKESEIFSMEDLLYALVVKSANDAAVALARHVAGSTSDFIAAMNDKARELGMGATDVQSVHGLPPGPGQTPDITTARDIGILCRAAVRNPPLLNYTSTSERPFRDGAFSMKSHNKLLHALPGCDGLKTGYYRNAGFSIAATAIRDGKRVIVVVLGSKTKAHRDRIATAMLERGFVWMATGDQRSEVGGQKFSTPTSDLSPLLTIAPLPPTRYLPVTSIGA